MVDLAAYSQPVKRIRISLQKWRLIVRCFASDCTAWQTAQLALVNYNTAKRYTRYLRLVVAVGAQEERQEHQISNGVEIDESYFGPHRLRGKPGRSLGGKVIVLGLLKRGGAIHCEIISGAARKDVLPIIRTTVKAGSDIYTDGWRSYDALAVYGFNHKKVNHEVNEFSREGMIHINGIESFWSFAKRRLVKFNGIHQRDFPIYLLETEWRFNHRHALPKAVRQLVRQARSDP